MEGKKYQIQVRNLDEFTVTRLTDLAKEAGMNRENYLRTLLKNFALQGEVKEVEEKYVTLIQELMDYIQTQGEILEQNIFLMEEMKERLDAEKL